MSGNMREMIIKSLNGKLKDGIKANDIVNEIMKNENTKPTSFHGKLKISEENSIRILEEIMTQFEVDEFGAKEAATILNKIRFGKLYIENEKLIYKLSKSIDMGDGPKLAFQLRNPEQAAFTENDINLLSIIQMAEQGNVGVIQGDMMPKTACIFMGIPCDFMTRLTLGDAMAIFQIGMQLFLVG
ncbi:hypothetical protein KAR91_30285 [Candidatus Pacearchaeota archaeon]|nr:hypothetical protein [Candidatus Pacearchaeota archaeon]